MAAAVSLVSLSSPLGRRSRAAVGRGGRSTALAATVPSFVPSPRRCPAARLSPLRVSHARQVKDVQRMREAVQKQQDDSEPLPSWLTRPAQV